MIILAMRCRSWRELDSWSFGSGLFGALFNIQGVPESVPCVNKNNSRDICSCGKNIFGNLGHVLTFWIYSGVNKVSVIGLGGLQERVWFSTFSHMFLRTFPISRCLPMLSK